MRRQLVAALVASVLGLTLGAGCRLRAEGDTLAAAQPVPSFALQDQRGQTVELSQLLAKGPAIVVFYRGFW